MRKTADLRVELLKRFYDQGYSLREAMHPMRLGYRPSALAALCQQNSIFFRDLNEVEAEGRELARKRRGGEAA
jgi:hypothetical protein